MEEVTHWVIERAAKMPQEHKFAIGEKLVETCLDVTCLLVEASYTRDKLALLAAFVHVHVHVDVTVARVAEMEAALRFTIAHRSEVYRR